MIVDKVLTITFKEEEPGRWLAMSNGSPYFCVEAGSLEDVRNLALEAVRFHREYIKQITTPKQVG